MAPSRLALAAATGAAALSRASAQLAASQTREVTLTGACDSKSMLNGLTFRVEGYTLSGAPWFKAVDALQYMYWDPDCADSGDGSARWILDNDKPNPNVAKDLDGDGACNYHARINMKDMTFPPVQGTWIMNCEAGWLPTYLILLPKGMDVKALPATTTTSTCTSTMPPAALPSKNDVVSQPTSRPVFGAPQPCPTCPPTVLVLSGACENKRFLNGATFDIQNQTADGSPWYKARGKELYIWHDPDCDGPMTPDTPARWVIAGSRPVPTRLYDLDGDGKCNYDARLDTNGVTYKAGPPSSAIWKMYCGDALGWQDTIITLQVISRNGSSVVGPIYVNSAHGRSALAALALPVAAALLAR